MSVAKVASVLLVWIAFHSITAILTQGNCRTGLLSCTDKSECIYPNYVCDGDKDCRDGSDEIGCGSCSSTQFRCADRSHCIHNRGVCNGKKDCPDVSDERACGTTVSDRLQRSNSAKDDVSLGNKVLNVPGVASTRARLISWFKQRRKSGSTVDKWGFQLHRVAVALHLANESIFSPGNTTGQEISYELTIQLLHHLSKDKKMSSQELALYIHAMLVACMDPRDFYGLNLVQELRKRTEEVNYTNPFQILVLCNAGDTMTTKDVDRVTAAYDSQRRPFWTEKDSFSILIQRINFFKNADNYSVHSGIVQSGSRLHVHKIQPRHGREDSKRHATRAQEAPVQERNGRQLKNHSACGADCAKHFNPFSNISDILKLLISLYEKNSLKIFRLKFLLKCLKIHVSECFFVIFCD
ncbi:UNVERIFIED_CONTAM: Lrp2 [Trichonephila clavipes]